MHKYLSGNGENTFDKIFDQKLGKFRLTIIYLNVIELTAYDIVT